MFPQYYISTLASLRMNNTDKESVTHRSGNGVITYTEIKILVDAYKVHHVIKPPFSSAKFGQFTEFAAKNFQHVAR
jgi:hypothetical protein